MADMVVKSAFVGIEFPVSAVTRYEIARAPTKHDFFNATGAYNCVVGFPRTANVIVTGMTRCQISIDGFIYTDASEERVAFVGKLAMSFEYDAEWIPCFGTIDFTASSGEIIVRDRMSR